MRYSGGTTVNLRNISLPEVYKSSSDFRFFVDWFITALSKIQYDIENEMDLYDPMRCPSSLLWMLCDTMGFKYDDRLPPSYNRFVLHYFMSMIRNKGSETGMLLGAEVNVAQKDILLRGKENNILYDRLEDVSIPVNSAYVNSHVDEGYIEVVYFSTERPVDACLEYVRPLGMYVFDYAGVRCDVKTHLSIDARLTNMIEAELYHNLTAEEQQKLSTTQFVQSTSVGHYSREDYARLQKGDATGIDYTETRRAVWYRNSESEASAMPANYINPGYRALYSLQLCNNDHIVRALIRSDEDPTEVHELDPIFSIPVSSVDVSEPAPATLTETTSRSWNLKYNVDIDRQYTYHRDNVYDVSTIETRTSGGQSYEAPAVNPPMFIVGDAISLADDNSEYYNASDEQNLV